MSDNKKILIADLDRKVTSALRTALKARGYDIIVSHDGAVALQKALSEMPGMIVLSVDLPTIDGIKLSQILHSNPRTEPIPFVFLSETDIQIPHFQSHKDSLFIKPVNVDEVSARIHSYFDRVEKTREVSREGRVIEGSLSEISLPDLLQMFSMNKKDGRLSLGNNKESGDIYILDGNIIDATIGEIGGEKALFRLLTWKSGNFKFIPSRVAMTRKISRPTDNLIMEGLRQYDEWESLKDKFPSMDARLKVLIDPSTLPKGLRPITQEIFLLIEFYPRVSDIVDRTTFPDYEVMRTIMTLISKGIVEITLEKGPEEKPILPKEDVLKLREKLATHKNYKLDREIGKVLIFSSNNEQVKYVINALNTLPEFYVHHDFLKGLGPTPYLGIAGRLQLSESVQINFIVVPVSSRFSPLWRPLSNSMLCGVAILDNETEGWGDLENLSKYFQNKISKTLAFVMPEAEPLEETARDLKKRLGLKKDIMLYRVVNKDAKGVRTMLRNLLHSAAGGV